MCELALVEQLRGLLGLSRKFIAQDKDTPSKGKTSPYDGNTLAQMLS